jgi:hypothetical protein
MQLRDQLGDLPVNQRYAGIVTNGTNLTRSESTDLDALIARAEADQPSLEQRRAKILADIDADNARFAASFQAINGLPLVR